MFNTLPSIIELPKLNNNIFLKKNKKFNNTLSIKYIKKGKQIYTPPIKHMKKNNLILKLTFGKTPFSIIFDKKN